MIETKIEKVSPSQEENTIELRARFGWNLKSSQEINTSESHLENRGGDIYSVSTKENYVKLLFERDKDMPNYNEIAKLENEMYTLLSKIPHFSVPLLICTLAIGFIAAVYLRDALPNVHLLVFGIPLLIPPIIYLVSFVRKTIKYAELFDEEERRIFGRVDQLMNNSSDEIIS